MGSALSSKGQVTIPKEIREHLKVGPGGIIKWFRHPNGGVMVFAERPVTRLRGIAKWKGKPVSIEEMNEAIEKEATARYRRFLKS
jgi:AbrB family looped-hinge helix DNA binding protein